MNSSAIPSAQVWVKGEGMVTPVVTIDDGNWVNGSSCFFLQHARNISGLEGGMICTFKEQVRVRLFTIGAVAAAALEVLAHLALATIFIGLSTIKKIICLVLQGVFVGMWALIGWLSGQALVKSPLQWVSFVLLQGMLGFSNPAHWVSQWRLWARILHSMGSFANGAAAIADWISDSIDSFSSWEHISMHAQHASHLILFVLASLRASLIYPRKAIANYGQMVKAWPLDATELKKIAEQHLIKGYHPAAIVGAVLAVSLVAHFVFPGYEYRQHITQTLTKYTWTSTGLIMRGVMKLAATLTDETLGRIWRWYNAGPDENVRNEAAAALKEIKDLLKQLTEMQKNNLV